MLVVILPCHRLPDAASHLLDLIPAMAKNCLLITTMKIFLMWSTWELASTLAYFPCQIKHRFI